MATYTLRDAADLLGVSVDTARRWAESGRLPSQTDDHGRRSLDGVELARFMATQSADDDGLPSTSSMRNRFVGIVTKVTRGDVAAQVEVQSGPHRFVSLLTREAVDDLDLHEGDLAMAVVKATNVSVEVPS
jgi:molybdopterin-binding protein